MKSWANRFSLLAVAAVLIGLGACSSSDSDKDKDTNPPPVTKTVVTNGVITALRH